ncbi:MAG: hypothetical protein PVH68_16040 [Armatimonadota bacterium]
MRVGEPAAQRWSPVGTAIVVAAIPLIAIAWCMRCVAPEVMAPSPPPRTIPKLSPTVPVVAPPRAPCPRHRSTTTRPRPSRGGG